MICGLIFLLGSCTAYSPNKNKKTKKLYTPSSYELEARLSDIALPLGFKTQSYKVEEQQQVLTGRTILSHAELLEFYHHEMERLGWALQALFSTDRTYFVFEKPHKTCLVILSQQAFKLGTSIEILIKK